MSDSKHAATICVGAKFPGTNVTMTHYVGKGYKTKFVCPLCGRSAWQHLSFLGARHLVCDGQKFTKVDKKEE